MDFWRPLDKAFTESDGFTVHFYLSGIAAPLECSCTPPKNGTITGELFPDRNPITIRMDSVVAYMIEES